MCRVYGRVAGRRGRKEGVVGGGGREKETSGRSADRSEGESDSAGGRKRVIRSEGGSKV